MGSIADTYKEKKVMSHRMWSACIKLDMIEWKELNKEGHITQHEGESLEEGPRLDEGAFGEGGAFDRCQKFCEAQEGRSGG